MNQDRIALGGGCHWCTEAVFLDLRGVERAEQGFVRSDPPFEAFSEAVIVSYDPTKICLVDLINIHLHTHSSTSQHSMRSRYRSAIYFFMPEQENDIRNILCNLQNDFSDSLVTLVLPFVESKAAHGRYQNYYKKAPDKPFCKRYIDPKLNKLRTKYARLLKSP